MNDNERKAPPAQAQEGHAKHGYRNEVTWDDGKGRQPYANRGDEEQEPAPAHGTEAGNRGEASGRNQEQLDALRRTPGRAENEAPRQDGPGGAA